MPWLSLTLEIDAAAAEAYSEALLEHGALCVSLEDAAAGTAAEQACYAEPPCEAPATWQHNRLSALLHLDTDVERIVAAAAACGVEAPAVLGVSRVEDADWVRLTQSQFPPARITERLWIVPSWHEPTQRHALPTPWRDALVLRLDPGLAFGTGSHATTRLALRWLARELRGGEGVLDYGCGSGILAIAAARLGAAAVAGVDIDPQALAAAAGNAERNGVALSLYPPDELPPDRYDVIVANILAAPLIVLAPLFAAHSRAGGRLALSGILEAQAADVVAAYSGAFAAAVAEQEEG